jgi:N-acyl homoserine lactone hydrolase
MSSLFRKGRRGRAVLLLLLALAVVVLAVRSVPIAEAPPHARAVPALTSLPKVGICWVEYARRTAPGPAAMAGWSSQALWNVTTAGLLVRHPRGDVLVDTGFSSHYDEELTDYPWLLRFWFQRIRSKNAIPAPDAVRARGADPERLAWVILSHAHIDHAGGMVDLPRVPVLVPRAEIDFFAEYRDQKTRKVIPAHAYAVQGRTTAIQFQPKPYETFDESADLFGDGSIVMVKLSGHTPGSVGTFVNVSPQRRLFHVGDAVNVMEAIEARRTKSIIMSASDDEPAAADAVVARLAQLHAMAPEITILPAHDRTQWQRVFGPDPRCD